MGGDSSWGDFPLEGGGTHPKNSSKPIKSYSVMENHIGLIFQE